MPRSGHHRASFRRAFWATYLNNHDEMLPFYEAETEAIQGVTPTPRAPHAPVGRRPWARIMLAELVRRGVFSPSAWRGSRRLRSE